MKLCPGCKLPIDKCYYGGDCLEMQLIYREQQREILADIDIGDLTGECMVCGTEATYDSSTSIAASSAVTDDCTAYRAA